MHRRNLLSFLVAALIVLGLAAAIIIRYWHLLMGLAWAFEEDLI